jgi:hypothetical protein
VSKLPGSIEGDKQAIADVVWRCQAVKKKDTKKVAGLKSHAAPGVLETSYPNLAQFLTTALYDDGEEREAPTMTLWAQGGLWKLSIKDRAEGLVMWLSAEKLLELMQLADIYCLEEDAPWRRDAHGDADKGKRLKKG